jgi:hypothetical protein
MARYSWYSGAVLSFVFTIRTIHPDEGRVDIATYDLAPTNEQGEMVCRLFVEFLASHPPEFREKIPFLKKDGMELQWAAGEGAAFASFFDGGEPVSMGILLTGLNEEADTEVLASMRNDLLRPIVGDEADRLTEAPDRPVLINVVPPGRPEMIPVVDVLCTALASVFFRAVQQANRPGVWDQ